MWWACRLSVFKIQVQCVLICLQIWNAEESHGTSFILWMWRLKTFCLIEILECYHDFRIRRFQEVITKATWPAVTCNISLFSSKTPHVPHMQLPVGTLCFSIQQPHLGEKGLCLGFVDILLQKQVGTSWNSHYVLSMLRLPISAYAVCVTHPQMLDLSTGAPGGECANTAISNMTNIYHMYFVFSPLFFLEGKAHTSWQVLLVLSLHARTQALGIASRTGSRRWWCLQWPWAPEGAHCLFWDVACPLHCHFAESCLPEGHGCQWGV